MAGFSPCRGRYRRKTRYNGATTWPPYVLSCSRNRRVFSVPWEHFVGFFIRSDRQALHYRGPAGASLGIILRERQRDVIPREDCFAARRDFLERKREVFWRYRRGSIELTRENYARVFAGEDISLLTCCISLRRHYNDNSMLTLINSFSFSTSDVMQLPKLLSLSFIYKFFEFKIEFFFIFRERKLNV